MITVHWIAILGVLVAGMAAGYFGFAQLLESVGYKWARGGTHCSICGASIHGDGLGVLVSPYFAGVLACEYCQERGLVARYGFVDTHQLADLFDEEELAPLEARDEKG